MVDLKIDTNTVPFLQLGVVGVALYRGPAGAFPDGTNATNTSLIDTVVYATGQQVVDHSLVDKLLPGKTLWGFLMALMQQTPV